MSYRVGIIGCGRMAGTIDDEHGPNDSHPDMFLPRGHVTAYASIPDTQVVAAADIDNAKLQSWCDRYGVPSRYADYRDMIQREALDIVSVTVHASHRAQPIVYAAENGVRGIYAEKALCATTDELRTIIDASSRHDTQLVYGPMRRYWAGFQTVRRVIESGDLGAPKAVLLPTTGSLFHGDSHYIDVAMYLLGDPSPQRVRGDLGEAKVVKDADGSYRLEKDPRVDFALIDFDNGTRLIFTELPRRDIEIVCEKGVIRGQGDSSAYSMRRPDGTKFGWENFSFPRWSGRSGTVEIIRDLIRSVETGKPGLSNLETARRGMEIAFALAQSHRQGGAWISLPLDQGIRWSVFSR